ncbi:MAG: tRNA threonylcarbamoyladenosine biosynthesis protein TsaE [Cytophagales bacterium]|jgi:tRNA threonylcarbamoyladenosine biosynthesis protein TsaE|nr:tRNA (adenosine(37)-N6)-threonylcarbamoyltransferase complex ATPase subunit type 1 TsaE [Bacteroidota bacterium]MBS1981200.1 tRNA (adenosine(37)-N6)-threonylcarbamoyltransferase complex ATPase subunit type 1 TsaE [Bacteroidota bacterium]WHZ06554.1 MAG: tRNA threonylcarbamoyladenosine biosynthesis protein TsaE [Cytophagales bacterium]
MAETEQVTDRITYSLEAIRDAAKHLLTAGRSATVWALYGAMGSGKTTLVKALMQELGTNKFVASPTFSIVNEYRDSQNQPIYHFDFYRIKDETEAFDIGADEYFDSGKLCLVEWPEKIPSLMPRDHFEIHIGVTDNHTRTLHYRNHGG